MYCERLMDGDKVIQDNGWFKANSFWKKDPKYGWSPYYIDWLFIVYGFFNVIGFFIIVICGFFVMVPLINFVLQFWFGK